MTAPSKLKSPEEILSELMKNFVASGVLSDAYNQAADDFVAWKHEQEKLRSTDKFDFETILDDLISDMKDAVAGKQFIDPHEVYGWARLALAKKSLLNLPLPAHYEVVDWQGPVSLSAEHQKPIKIRASAEDTGFYADVTCPNGHKASIKIEVQSGSVRVFLWPADEDGEIKDEPFIKFGKGYNEFDGFAILAEF
jgi:hypothetical protein